MADPEEIDVVAELLDAYQIEASIQFVNEHWPAQATMLPDERERWAEILAYVQKGELAPVIERWATSTRPTPDAVLDYILTTRTRQPVVPKEPPAPDLGGKVTPVVAESIAQARKAIQRRLDDKLVSCSPDPR